MLVKAKSRKLKNMLEIQGVCNNIMPDPIVKKAQSVLIMNSGNFENSRSGKITLLTK